MIRGLARVISEAPLLYRHAQIYTLSVKHMHENPSENRSAKMHSSLTFPLVLRRGEASSSERLCECEK